METQGLDDLTDDDGEVADHRARATAELDQVTRQAKQALNRFRLPSGYPVLAELVIDPVDWFQFERLVGDTPVSRIVGHDDPDDGLLQVYVACASDEVRERLEDGWC